MNLESLDLAVPDFLVVDKAEGERRRAWAAAHPVVALNFSGQSEDERRDVDEARARMKAEQKARELEHLQALADRKREEAQALAPHQFAKQLPGMIWSPRYGKWVSPDFMSASKYARLLRDMPSDKHRAAFIKQFGSGHGASAGAGGSPVSATSHATKAKATPAGEVSGESRKSPAKVAGRVRVPSESGGVPRGASAPIKSALSTNTPTRSEKRLANNAAMRTKNKAKGAQPSPFAPITTQRMNGISPSVARGDGVWMPRVIAMLRRPQGATLAEVGAAEGWLEHSASARLSAIRKEHNITATKEDRGRVYRMEQAT